MSNISIKNTKDQIFAAYQEALDKVKELKKGKTLTAEVVKTKEVKETKEKAKEIISLDILNEDMKDKYNALLKTLDLVKGEIEELYGIKKEADTLEALINAYKDKTRELDELYKEKSVVAKKAHEVELANLLEIKNKIIEDNSKLKENLDNNYKEEKSKLNKERDRENEEYKYELERSKKIDNDMWQESKTKRLKELQEEVTSKINELTAREESVASREALVEIKDSEIQELKTKINELEATKSSEITEAIKSGKADAAKEFGIQKNMIEKEAKWEKERLNDKIANLEKELMAEKEAHKVALGKLDVAYGQIQEIATKTVMANNTRIVEKSN